MTHTGTIGRVFIFAACLVAANCQQAQAATWYQVELILFRYQAPLGVDGEKWVGNVGEPDVADVLNLIEDIPEFEDEPQPDETLMLENPQPMAFLRLPKEEQRLNQIEQRLASSSNIEVLAHLAWRQPSFGNANARTVFVSSAAVPAVTAEDAPLMRRPLNRLEFAPLHEIYGTIRYRRATHSHINADFVLKGEGPPVRLTETRKMRLGELHYFDHPLFGVLAQVTPYVFSPREDGGDEDLREEAADDEELPPEP